MTASRAAGSAISITTSARQRRGTRPAAACLPPGIAAAAAAKRAGRALRKPAAVCHPFGLVPVDAVPLARLAHAWVSAFAHLPGWRPAAPARSRDDEPISISSGHDLRNAADPSGAPDRQTDMPEAAPMTMTARRSLTATQYAREAPICAATGSRVLVRRRAQIWSIWCLRKPVDATTTLAQCRIADVTYPYIHALSCMSLTAAEITDSISSLSSRTRRTPIRHAWA